MKKFIKLFIISTVAIMLSVSLLNWYIDPMWAFEHKQSIFPLKEEIDERQQKTNLVYFQDFNHDGIMIGSSTMTIVNQTEIKQYNVFNYAANAMSLYEFNNFIEYAKKKNGKDFKVIILGIDLWSIEIPKKINIYDFENLINNTENPFYKIKMLLSSDVLKFTKTNIYFNVKESAYSHHFKIYNNNYIAYTIPKDPLLIKQKLDNFCQKKDDVIYNRNSYLESLKILKENNPNSKIILVTIPPNAAWLHTLMLQPNTESSYRQWLKDLTENFDQIYHFAYINSVTKDYPNTFVDPGHYNSDIGKLMMDTIFNQPIDANFLKYTNDFGIVLTKDNYKNYIDKFIFDAKNYQITGN